MHKHTHTHNTYAESQRPLNAAQHYYYRQLSAQLFSHSLSNDSVNLFRQQISSAKVDLVDSQINPTIFYEFDDLSLLRIVCEFSATSTFQTVQTICPLYETCEHTLSLFMCIFYFLSQKTPRILLFSQASDILYCTIQIIRAEATAKLQIESECVCFHFVCAKNRSGSILTIQFHTCFNASKTEVKNKHKHFILNLQSYSGTKISLFCRCRASIAVHVIIISKHWNREWNERLVNFPVDY